MRERTTAISLATTRSAILLGTIWIAVLAASLAWNWRQVGHSMMVLAESEACSSFRKDLVYRHWASLHGGVYVPPTEATPPNPYLARLPHRDETTTSGRHLTLINPAYMTRQVHELGKQQYGLLGHITSLNPLRSENSADAWETEALLAFQDGVEQATSVETIGDNAYFRLMRPLVVQQSCMTCHTDQGYAVGDVIGGISVSVPLHAYMEQVGGQRTALALVHILLGFFGLIGIGTGHRLLRRTETKLRASEQHLSATLRSIGDGVITCDRGGRVTSLNRVAEALTGWNTAEAAGRPLEEVLHIVHAQTRQTVDNPVARALAEGVSVELANHTALIARDGTERPIADSCAPIRDAEGIVTGAVLVFRDVTERCKLERQLRRSRAALDVSADDLFIIDRSTMRFVDVNDTACNSLGYGRDELLSMGPHDIKPHFTKEALAKEFDRVLDGGPGIGAIETIHARKDGTQFPVEVHFRGLDQDGTALLVASVRDVTNHKRAEEALRESEQRFKSLFMDSPVSILIHDRDTGAIVDANPTACSMYGIASVEELKTCNIWLDPPYSFADALAWIRKAALEGPQQFEWLNRKATGEMFWEQVYLCGVTINGVERVLATTVDITSRKRWERELGEQTRLLNTLLDGIPDVVSLQEPDHTVVRYNRAGYELLDLTPKACHGRKCYELVGQGVPCASCPAKAALRSKKIETVERYLPDRNLWFEVRSIPVLDHDDNVVLLVDQLHDITERKHMEDALRDANDELRQTVDALESANRALEEFNEATEAATRAKSEFLANMSHEIRTPMTAILGFTEVLLGEAALDRAPPERIEAIETIQRNGNYLLQLINDILDLSKIEAGKLDIERTTCSPTQVLADVISLMRVRAAAKGILLDLEYAGGIPEAIQCDPLRLRQILVNLVGNAIKFTETGSVRMVPRLMRPAGEPALLQVEVIDTGIGLTAEQASRLFQPFSQADSSTTRRFGGTGLGLTISKRLAEMLGGNITFHSEPGKGSTFRVTVEAGDLAGVRLLDGPAEAVAPAAQAPAAGNAAAALRLDGRILLAEDGPDNQRLIGFVLKKAGAEVTVAENGQIAVAEALAARERNVPFDLILMDMQMPVLDGYEATRRLRAAGYTGPILALTAHAMAGDDAKCLDAGCDGYLSKPIDRAMFLPAIAERLKPAPTTREPQPKTASEYTIPDTFAYFQQP